MMSLFTNPKCDDCGRFTSTSKGASTADIFDFVAMGHDHTRVRCAGCTQKLGPVQSNARPANGDMSPYQTRHW